VPRLRHDVNLRVSHAHARLVLARSRASEAVGGLNGMQMDSQPYSTFRRGLDDVYGTRGQEQMVARFQDNSLARHLNFRLAANENDPLVLRLNILFRSDVRGTHDSLDHEVLVCEKNVKALAGTGG
jgi:hypothetical protein